MATAADAESIALPGGEASRQRLTRPFLYKYEFQALQNASAVLILTPVKPAG